MPGVRQRREPQEAFSRRRYVMRAGDGPDGTLAASSGFDSRALPMHELEVAQVPALAALAAASLLASPGLATNRSES